MMYVTENNLSSLKIFPNPSSGLFTIQSEGESIQSVWVYDVLGKQLVAQNIFGNHANFDLAEKSPGIYLIKIQFENKGIETRKLVIR